MKVLRSFPHRVREIENLFLTLSDGCRLAARVWLPEDADERPVPAILEYIPYRKRDLTRARDEPMHRYFAGHGYAAVRVDVRGSGDSDGVLADEYDERELADGVELIALLARQPWCDGRVGMMGKSWGGFNALQIAARRPPELGAILTVCAADDRYSDDAHYMGGCLLSENLIWGSVLFTLSAYPPDPEVVGERWRETWRERLEGTRVFAERWLRHPRRDAYWRHGSVCEDYGAIACPVYAVGGWADAYTNAVGRLLAGLTCPRKGLIGPWAHLYPHAGVPGPAIGFLQEALRWWDQWLKDRPTGILDEPMLRAWMQESAPPRTSYRERPGRWVAEESWPSPRIEPLTFALTPGRLLPEDDRETGHGETGLSWSSPATTGAAGGDWCGFGQPGEAPGDQRPDDGRSLVFDSEPLGERLEILGAPAIELELASDRPRAQLAARLEDVGPGGASTRVTYGLLCLHRRENPERDAPLAPGERFRVRLELNDVAYAFPPGHRLRLALSTAYWPIAWPEPEPVTLTVFPAASRLELPRRPPRAADGELAPFAEPESAPPPEHTELRPPRCERRRTDDLVSGESVYEIAFESGGFGAGPGRLEAIELAVTHDESRRFAIRDGDPLSARAEIRQETTFHRGDWEVAVATRTRMRSTPDHHELEAELEAAEGGAEVFRRRWRHRVPR